MSVHWQCPDCHDYLGDYQVQEPYCDRCKRHGKMRFSEPSEIATLRAQLADAIAFVRKAGHLPGCAAGANSCQFSAGEHEMKCGAIKGAWWHNRGHTHFGHDFQPGPCSCGHDEVVGV